MARQLRLHILLDLIRRASSEERPPNDLLRSVEKGHELVRSPGKRHRQLTGDDADVCTQPSSCSSFFLSFCILFLIFALLTSFRQSRELQSASSVALGSLVAEAATSLGNLVVALHGSWKLTLVLLATVPVSLVVLSLLSRRFKSAIGAQKQELARASKYAISAVAAVDLVKIFNASDHETWQYLRAIQRSAAKYLVQAGAAACQHAYVKLWVEGMFVLGFYYGAVLVDGGASPGNIVTTFYAALAALQAFQAFVPTYIVLAKGMAAGQALHSIINDSAGGRKVRRMMGSYRPEECFGKVEINEVSLPA